MYGLSLTSGIKTPTWHCQTSVQRPRRHPGGQLLLQLCRSFVNPIGLENIGWKYYTVFCVVILVTIYLFFPETQGYSFEEITRIFDGEASAVEDRVVGQSAFQEKAGNRVTQVEDLEK